MWPCLLAPIAAARLAAGELVAAAVLPHGDFAYDPSLLVDKVERLAAQKLHYASQTAGRFVRTADPATVFLTTPHGLELSHDFLLYENPTLTGFAQVGEDLGPDAKTYNVSMTLQTDEDVVPKLLANLQAIGANVTGLEGFGMGMPLPISWGEVLPLSFLQDSSTPLNYRVVVMSVPYRRYDEDVAMAEELRTMGGAVGKFLSQLPGRVAWIVSSDLAHTHRADGPYGFCSCAAPFDAAVGDWMSSLDPEALREATKHESAGAKSCGYTGLLMLEGALNELGRDNWIPSMLALEAPTYYGMGVATFEHIDSVVV